MSDPTVSSQSGVLGMNASKKDKLCLVCGDKALGYNFNAVSCESCKAFFRRNAHKTIRGRCEGKCDVTVESRSFCKRCRLAKCFTVGMRKDMILNDEQKKIRKQKIMFNKLRRQGHVSSEDVFCAATPDLVSSVTTLTPGAPGAQEVKVKQEDPTSPASLPSCGNTTSPVVSYPSWADSQDLVASAIEQLTEEQRRLVTELQYAMEESSFLTVTTTTLKSLPSNPTEFVNIAEGFVRKVIKVAKNIAVFKTLQKDDQISLLKGSVVDIMMLRSAVNYDPHTESWSLSTKECLSKKSSDGEPRPPSSCRTLTPITSHIQSLNSSSPITSTITSPLAFDASSPTGSDDRFPSQFTTTSPSLGASASSPGIHSLPSLDTATSSSSSSSIGSPGSSSSRTECSTRITAEILKSGNSETRQLFMNYSKFIRSLMSSIHGDLLVLKVLIMMSLFSADRSALVEREKVQEVQESYAAVLQAYLTIRFTEDKTLFARLVMKLTDLRNINEIHSKMLTKMKVNDIEPLLLEIFDL